MVANFTEHANANLFLHTGFNQQGRPSIGSWVTYGLGSECQDLPGYIVLKGGQIPAGGLDNFHSGFLPAVHQGSIFRDAQSPGRQSPARPKPTDELQRGKLDLLAQARSVGAGPRWAAITRVEVGHRQLRAGLPHAVGRARICSTVGGETAATERLYGIDDESDPLLRHAVPAGPPAGRARRAVRRGDAAGGGRRQPLGPARPDQGRPRQDGPRHRPADRRPADGPQGPRPVGPDAGRLGRRVRPHAGGPGHLEPAATTVPTASRSGWPAAASEAGMVYGATDEYGFHAIENKVEIHDLHATMLHLLGIDHTRLTYRFGGRDMRLTDVHGNVLHELLI